MGIFSRRRPPPSDAELGVGSAIPVSWVDGQAVGLVEWTREQRRAVTFADGALRVFRAAGLRGTTHLRIGQSDGRADLEIVLRNGERLRLAVYATDDPSTVFEDIAFEVSTRVAREGEGPSLPGPLTATEANVQLLGPTGDLPARWCVCVFLTRAHDIPADADDAARGDLWIKHTVGVKLHLDGTVALDPADDDPDGARSRAALATAASWAGGPVDVLPYARWLAAETQRRLDVAIDGLGGA